MRQGLTNTVVERRKARRPASWAGVPSGEGTAQSARRATGCGGFRTSVLWRFTPLDLFERDFKAGHRAPGQERGRWRLPGVHVAGRGPGFEVLK